jgi:hypothetical protein
MTCSIRRRNLWAHSDPIRLELQKELREPTAGIEYMSRFQAVLADSN